LSQQKVSASINEYAATKPMINLCTQVDFLGDFTLALVCLSCPFWRAMPAVSLLPRLSSAPFLSFSGSYKQRMAGQS
jgi:hypothetical protein